MIKHKKWIVIALFVLLAVVICVCLWKGNQPKLSDMKDKELIRYIQNCGVTLPEQADDISVLRGMLRELEEDPNHEVPSFSGLSYWEDVYEDLRKVVKTYYRIDD